MNLSAKIAKNTAIQISGKVVSTILGLFSVALIARYLGQDGFGLYTTVLTFLTFFAVIADLGLTLVTAQMIGGLKEKDEENRILSNLFTLRLFSALLLLGLAPITVLFFPYPPAVKIGVVIAAAAFLFPALNQVIIGLFQKRLVMGRDALAEVIGRLVLIIGLVAAKKYDLGLNGVLISTVLAGAINFIFHYLCSRRYARIRLTVDFSLWKDIIGRSWPLAITIMLNLIYLRADTLILSLMKSPGEVGLYGAAYRVIDVLTTIPFMFAGLILPILTAAWLNGDRPYFRSILQKSFDVMAMLAIPLLVGAQFLGSAVMRFVAGQDFTASGPILQWLIFAVAAIFLGTMFSHAVIAIDKQRRMIGFYVFTSLSSLVAYLLLIPRFSYFGAAGVTIYSEMMIAVFSAYCVYKYSRCRLGLSVLYKSLLAGWAMGLLLYFFAPIFTNRLWSLIAVIIISSLAYFLFLYILGGIRAEELRTIFKRQKKIGGQIYDSSDNF